MRKLFLIAMIFCCFQGASAQEDISVTRLTLNNGMRVWMKPTNFDSEEVVLRLIAEGGFANLPEEERGAAELSATMALESGFGGMDPDHLSALFYEHAIEFSARVQPFSHLIEATLHSDSLPEALNLCKLYFTKQQLTEESFREVIKQTKEGLAYHVEDGRTLYEDAFKNLNTQNKHPLKPVKAKDLDRARFDAARDYLEASLADPSRFVCIILGDFDETKMKPILEATLGSIAKTTPKKALQPPSIPEFPKEPVTKVINFYGRADSVGRLTFPLVSPVEETHAHALDVGVQALEVRLRQVMQDRYDGAHMCVNVTYELPFYPLRDLPWIVIQYRSEPRKTAQVKDVLLSAIQLFHENGPTPGEVEKVEGNIHRNQEYWLNDNDYWLALLTNYAIWDWDPAGIVTSDPKNLSTAERVKQVFQAYVPKNRYTWLYSQN